MLTELGEDVVRLDARIAQVGREIEALADRDDRARRLMTIPGIGHLAATACSRRSEMGGSSAAPAISPLGLVSCRASTRPGGGRFCWASPSEGTDTPDPASPTSTEAATGSAVGSTDCKAGCK